MFSLSGVVRYLRNDPRMMWEQILKYMPGNAGASLRRRYWSTRFNSCGGNLYMATGITIDNAANIDIGSDVVLGANSYLGSQGSGAIIIGNRVAANRNVMVYVVGGKIIVGDNVLIGPNVVVIPDNHIYSVNTIPIRDQGISAGEIVIEEDVWIGANAVILPDVRIGKGTIVAAGATVTKSTAPYSIIAGVPAKVIGER